MSDPVTVLLEGRRPLPGQHITRQTYLEEKLTAQGISVTYVDVNDPSTFNEVNPERSVWRLRDVVWPDSPNVHDPPAFRVGHGYNSSVLRHDLQTRSSVQRILGSSGLAGALLDAVLINVDAHRVELPPGDQLFVKPSVVTDIGETAPGGPARRAKLVPRDDVAAVIAAEFGGQAIVQPIHQRLSPRELADALGIADLPPGELFQTLRFYQPLWLSANDAPAAELRSSQPEQVGQRLPTAADLLEPATVREAFPQLAALHQHVHFVLLEGYGEHNYPAVDYLIEPDGQARVVNVLARAFTPNLEGHRGLSAELARATADVEVAQLQKLAEHVVSGQISAARRQPIYPPPISPATRAPDTRSWPRRRA